MPGRYEKSKYSALRAALGTTEGPDGAQPSIRVGRVYNPANYVNLIALLTAAAPREDRRTHGHIEAPRQAGVPPAHPRGAPHAPATGNAPPRGRQQEVGGMFRGVADVSQRGIHPVLRYDIPGGPLCYTFVYHKSNAGYEVYRCAGCKKEGRRTAIAVREREFFAADPCLLPHVCVPRKSAQDEATRVVYKACQNVSATPAFADVTPRQLWQDVGSYVDFHSNEDPHRREEMLHFFHRSGYECRRRTFSRAVGKLHDHRVSMTEVPDRYRRLPDGTPFLQHFSAELHIYYSVRLIERACALGLQALVADGVHNLQPEATNHNGQLYFVHGVTGNGVDFPLLYAITMRKTETTYETIFRTMKTAMGPAALQGLRIVLDFELAAINAARKVFPGASVEGCAFHLAQAWNRRRDALGLTQYVRGTLRCRSIRKWWSTIKGLVFLPPYLHRRVPALFRPPVPRDHPAHGACCRFLEYLRTNWYAGPFENMWFKWEIAVLRTSNLAESFNRKIGHLLRAKYPPMAKLLREFQRSTSEVKGALLNVERRRMDGKKLHKKDILRRRRVQREMNRFKSVLEESWGFPSTVSINTFCSRMSRFVTEKVV